MSDDNVVTFGGNKKDDDTEYLFVCDCGCRTFNLFSGGYMKCSFCETPVNAGNRDDASWRASIPTAPEDKSNIATANDGHVTKNDLPDASLARRRVLKAIGAWEDDKQLVLVGAYNVHGEGRWWTDIRSEDQREWATTKIAEILAWVDRVEIDASNELQIVNNGENDGE